MLYLTSFAVITGTIASFAFFLVYKRSVKKMGNRLMKKSFIMKTPKIFGSINIFLAVFFGIWFIVNPSAFSQDTSIDNKVVFILLSIFYTYFYILALPLSIGSTTLTILLKKIVSKTRFLYCLLTNVVASILLFFLSYLILF